MPARSSRKTPSADVREDARRVGALLDLAVEPCVVDRERRRRARSSASARSSVPYDAAGVSSDERQRAERAPAGEQRDADAGLSEHRPAGRSGRPSSASGSGSGPGSSLGGLPGSEWSATRRVALPSSSTHVDEAPVRQVAHGQLGDARAASTS